MHPPRLPFPLAFHPIRRAVQRNSKRRVRHSVERAGRVFSMKTSLALFFVFPHGQSGAGLSPPRVLPRGHPRGMRACAIFAAGSVPLPSPASREANKDPWKLVRPPLCAPPAMASGAQWGSTSSAVGRRVNTQPPLAIGERDTGGLRPENGRGFIGAVKNVAKHV